MKRRAGVGELGHVPVLCDKCGQATAFEFRRGIVIKRRGAALCGSCCGDPTTPEGRLEGWEI